MIKKLSLIILIILICLSYIGLDRQLFYYGESNFSYDCLPFKLKPENKPDFEGGFVIWDKFGFSLVGKGVKYMQADSITIEKLTEYGFTNDLFIAHIVDKKEDEYTFEFTLIENSDYMFDISVHLSNNRDFKNKEIKWIDINDTTIQRYILARTLLMFLFIGFIIILIIIMIRKKQPANN